MASTSIDAASTSDSSVIVSSTPLSSLLSSAPSSLSDASSSASSVTPSSVPAESSAAPTPTSSPAASSPQASSSAVPDASSTPAPSSETPTSTPSPAAPVSSPGTSAPAPSSAGTSPAPVSTPSAEAPTTVVITASSATPSVTEVATSIITVTPSTTVPGETPSVIVITSLITPTGSARSTIASSSGSAPSASNTNVTPQKSESENSSGLSTGGKTAIAVVVPLVVVGLLVLAGIIFWRKRKQRKGNEEERRKEVEEYGYNPNHDPTLPAVGIVPQMAEDDSGYRGWGNTATSSGRKASTTLTSAMAYSDSTSNPDGYANPGSPTNGTYSDAHSGDPLMNGRRETMESDGVGALGSVGAAAPNSTQNQIGIQRGISNASSTYSAADHSDNSGDYPGMVTNHNNDFYADQGYYQANPYGNDPYGAGGQPVIRDVSARRNTQIQNPSVFPQQGNSGISQNF